MKTNQIAIFALGMFLSAAVMAGNVTLVHEFTGAEEVMPKSQASVDWECGFIPSGSLPYHVLGTFTVSESGQYRVADFQIGWLTGPKTRSVNTVLLIYQGSFDARNPVQNRVAVFDYGELNWINNEAWVELDSSKNYRAVLQMTCDAAIGSGGFIMRGPGNISGVGFPTPAGFYGDFAQVSNSNYAEFPDMGAGAGFHKYAEPYTYTAQRSGFYWFFDLSLGIGGGEARPWVYSAPFDPSDPSANLLGAPQWWLMRLYLEAGQQIHVVVVDQFDSEAPYQGIIHAPGELLGINTGFTGTYLDSTRAAQGFLIDLDEGYGILFAALFTFNNAPAALQAASGSGKQSVGSGDQRWLTAYGSFSADSTVVDLSFENSTGGRFNQVEPPVERDSSYGTGRLIAHDCKRIDIEYDLPDAQGVFTLTRGLPGFTEECAQEIPVAAPTPAQ